jgi:hypothetical protein
LNNEYERNALVSNCSSSAQIPENFQTASNSTLLKMLASKTEITSVSKQNLKFNNSAILEEI